MANQRAPTQNYSITTRTRGNATRLPSVGLHPVQVSNHRFGDRPLTDPSCKGLRLVASRTAHSWIYRYELDGQMKQVKIGNRATMSLAQARVACDAQRALRKDGKDIRRAATKQAAAAEQASQNSARQARSYTVEAMLDDYDREHLRLMKSGAERFRTLQFDTAEIAGRAAASITRAEVQTLIDRVKARGARRLAVMVLGDLKRAFEHAIEHDRIASNPAAMVRSKIRAVSRDRRLSDSELRKLFTLMKNPRKLIDLSVSMRDAMKLELLTASRQGEIFGMRVDEFEFDLPRKIAWWHVPPERMKMRKPHSVHLNAAALDIIATRQLAQRRAGVKTPFLFPNPTDPNKPIGPHAVVWSLCHVRKELTKSGIRPEVARYINSVACGHPLALSMAASIIMSDPERPIEQKGLHEVIDALSRLYIEAVPDAITRRALEASSVVRCVTEPLLHALLPDIAPRDTLERLSALPFVEPGREGLFIHDAVRSAIATSLAARDPDAHREYRRAAWTYIQSRLRLSRGTAAWRYTADILFLIQNPVLREGFFPSGPHPLAIEPAMPGDEPAIHGIIAAHAAPEIEALSAWWRYHADGFRVVRDGDGSVCGFSIMIRASELHANVDAFDPIAALWRRDVASRDASKALFCRRWLDREASEAPCASQAASWVDLKRTYIEMRGTLQWVYTTVANLTPYGDVVTRLGFRLLSEPTADVGGQTLYSAILDMGPGSVDAWLTEMVGAEITAETPRATSVLDVDARELVLSSGRVALTSLEFGVMRYLQEHSGKAVCRFDLMEAVWGYRNATASNVVDVVVGSLRRKLGAKADMVQTVRGTGYRYQALAGTA